MRVVEYCADLHALLATTPFLAAKVLTVDERPPDAAVIKGSLRFADGSQLDFKEFVLGPPPCLVVKYGYHYRRGNHLVFRYDNAHDPAARHLPTFPHHLHLPTGLVAADQPSLTHVIREILRDIRGPGPRGCH